ncbi:MAG: hypothetical protein J7641_01705 [Cyanobacteria bacterium SID2]|nr:hypothetical protein [Cyanobacteria bacterium SID2]MBP0006562.1 hypothetical protein [Cyanobacteria bacterium SBC]
MEAILFASQYNQTPDLFWRIYLGLLLFETTAILGRGSSVHQTHRTVRWEGDC